MIYMNYGDSHGDDPQTIQIKRGTQVQLQNICSKKNYCQIQSFFTLNSLNKIV